MQIINSKYVDYYFSNDPNAVPPSDWRISLWEYIEHALYAQGINKKFLIDLFDVTPATLHCWENGTRQISQDKLVVLANLFCVSIDQLIERDLNDDYQYEDLHGLIGILERDTYKGLTDFELGKLFHMLAEATTSIEYFSLGYIPFEQKEGEPELEYDFFSINGCEMEYFCQTLQMNVEYDTKDGKKHNIDSITYKELQNISDLLSKDWGDMAHKHIKATRSKKYDEIILLSENCSFLSYVINHWEIDVNYFLELWQKIKNTNEEFDKENAMAKVLIANNAQVLVDGVPDETKTMKLIRTIIKEDVERQLISQKEEK